MKRASLIWVNPNYLKCFSCGALMVPFWRIGGMVPHSADPPRPWHQLCFERWWAYACGWRAFGSGTLIIIGPPVRGYAGKRIVSRAVYFANTEML